MQFQPFFPANLQTIALANVGLTTTQNVVTGGANGTKIESLVITNTDTIDHALLFTMNVAGVLANVCNINVPANTGNLQTLPLNLFANTNLAFLPQDASGNKYMYLANGSCSLCV